MECEEEATMACRNSSHRLEEAMELRRNLGAQVEALL
jgi:hypothetical protein